MQLARGGGAKRPGHTSANIVICRNTRTSRPSQNSASLIWPLITSSRCKAASSGSLTRTFLRRRKSLTGSIPVKTGVAALRSLATEAARWVAIRAGSAFGSDAVGVDTDMGAAGRGVGKASFGANSDALRFRLMIIVISFLNFSRSVIEVGCGEVKVKLCPASSPTRPIFSLTCGAPSLLQNRATHAKI